VILAIIGVIIIATVWVIHDSRTRTGR